MAVNEMRGANGHLWAATLSSGIAASMIAGTLLFGGGGFFSDTKGGIARLEKRLDSIEDKIDKGPRAETIAEIQAENMRQNLRMDNLRDENMALKVELTRISTRLEGIIVSSGKMLPGDRR